MRLDRIWRAGPFRGGLWADLSKLIAQAPDGVKNMSTSVSGKVLLEKTNALWQSKSSGRDMKADGLTNDARILFASLLVRGADANLAIKLVKSLANMYGSVTFAPIKFDRLLRAHPFLMDSIDGVPLNEVVSHEMSDLTDSTRAGLIYIEVACRALVADNSSIMGKYYDEVEVTEIATKPHFEIPMKRPFLAASRFLLITKGKDGDFHVSHFPSAKLLLMKIEEDSGSVEGLLQTSKDFNVFRSDSARRRWMYKTVLSALIGSSKAFWLRFGGILEELLKSSYPASQLNYVKRSNLTGVFKVLASPILSSIADSDWGRVATCSRINHIGGSVIEGSWEMELVSVCGISELPVVDPKRRWLFETTNPHSNNLTTEVFFETLPLDSESTRRIRIKETTTERIDALESSSQIAASTGASDTSTHLIHERLTQEELLIFAEVAPYYSSHEQEMVDIITAYERDKGAVKGATTIEEYTEMMYNELEFDKHLTRMFPEWDVQFTEAQRTVFRKKVRILSAGMYLKKFGSSTQGSENE
jgi:hypothetical protein